MPTILGSVVGTLYFPTAARLQYNAKLHELALAKKNTVLSWRAGARRDHQRHQEAMRGIAQRKKEAEQEWKSYCGEGKFFVDGLAGGTIGFVVGLTSPISLPVGLSVATGYYATTRGHAYMLAHMRVPKPELSKEGFTNEEMAALRELAKKF